MANFFDERILQNIPKKVKVVVGIPSFNSEGTISFVAKMAAEGLKEFFQSDGIIVNSDGGSSDNTKEVFMKTNTNTVPKISFDYIGLPGKGTAMLSILELAKFVNAEAVVFLDSDLKSIKPLWIERLTAPIINGYSDFVTPFYIRHKYDGTITNQVCYPLITSLFGKEIRQPIGGDFGVGKEMIDIYLTKAKKCSQTDVARFGIDIWLTTNAIVHSNKKIYQASLGAKIHDPKDPGADLVPMFTQVVGTLFNLLIEYSYIWKKNINNKIIEKAPIYGEILEIRPEPVYINVENLKTNLKKGLNNQLTKELALNYFDYISKNGKISLEMWVDILFNAIVRYSKTKDMNIIESIVPLYFGRVADFVETTQKMDEREAENLIGNQIYLFLEKKVELL